MISPGDRRRINLTEPELAKMGAIVP
jgi:hypothetical protein